MHPKHKITRRLAGLMAIAGLATALAATGAAAQPLDGPLRIVVGYAPGGATDRVARIVGDKLASKLGVPVIVDNKPGAGGRLAAQQVKVTPANQNVLMLANPAVMVVAPLVFKDNGYDAERDFVPVSHVNDYDFALAVSPTLPVRELNHLLAWMRANPQQANVGVPATGSLPHFFGLMVGEKAKVQTQVIGYRGSAPLLNDLIGGQVPIAVDTEDVVIPQHDGGKLRILAISGAKRSPFAPSVPTFKEAGLDLAASGWNTFFAPVTMPREKVERLATAIREVMQDPDTVRKFTDSKMTPVVSTQAQTAAMLKAYRLQWGPVVQKSGYQP
ncbi:ABC transporter substrate-binding protein [Variovorax paradoxus]|jgi:tripartite-type tricarboxylate transporter receptor subunit TctC|uniref:Bug family tripartite tricarboxylate transporter substrate binding protein n=1 Tax=Variovorax TaxID=34072 RepID=UPI0006E56BEE|nr:Bug family tripartite tricarboxylate transporter substrate binding protein [Variovorax sp. CY25R-8]KPU88860.1 ABC transporter substrate-binding protein [Variovorax paradoxus]KPU94047.1 ABC transporter substrate-binding protein [Variovorax paradoxus]KPV02312.1 ABC transporter substrate-binding protein [Variovorax paradoxus]KPV15887.1 ABC transporter substrate-binding protein [Variovorax paradoxus]KPV26411.1 ABC transporter substrate-binding protein [Variovorax paradoxus]